jgi:hypothetical protein
MCGRIASEPVTNRFGLVSSLFIARFLLRDVSAPWSGEHGSIPPPVYVEPRLALAAM